MQLFKLKNKTDSTETMQLFRKCFVFLSLCFVCFGSAFAQKIIKAEYFFDADPGAGNGTALSTGSLSDSVNISTGISIGTLTSGFHTLCIRVYGSTIITNSTIKYATSATGVPTVTGVTTTLGGAWSIYDSKSFYVSPNVTINPVPGIVAAEYYFDSDPGVGNGTALSSITNLDSININSSVSVGTLTSGFHNLAIRTKDKRGIWSIYDTRSFFVSPSVLISTVPGIINAEYFFDNDPGVGNGIALSAISNLDSVNISTNISIGTLTSGFHRLCVRTQDKRGLWGIYDSRSFYVPPIIVIATVPGIVAAEYYFDTDPGPGNGIALPSINNLDSLNLNNNISVGTLTGFHTLLVRTKDKRGIWGIADARNFYVKPPIQVVTVPKITKLEYFVDVDPGAGKGYQVSTGAAADSINLNLNFPLVTVPSGFHNIGVRVKNGNGIWSQLSSSNFYVKPTPTAVIPDPINYAEYYFNHSDPGKGKASPITLGVTADSINVTTNLNASSLFVGLDTVNLRVRTQSGKFSLVASRPFTVCNTAPIAKFTTDTVCVGNATTFTNKTTGASGTTTFAWNFTNGAGVNSTFAGGAFTNSYAAGNYTARLITSNGGPCTSTFTGTVVVAPGVPAQPSPISGNISVCKGLQTYAIQALPNVKYTWSYNQPALGIVTLSARKDTAYVNWTGTGTNYPLQVTPSNVCGSGTPISLYININNTNINASAGPDLAICKGDSVLLSASGGSSYLWINQNVTTSGLLVKPASTSGYIVKVTQGNCSAFDTAFVVVNQIPPSAVISISGDTLIANKVPTASYQWYLGNFAVGSNSNKLIPTYTGTYTVKIFMGNCATPLSAPFDFIKTVAGCVPQLITLNPIPSKLITDGPFSIVASVTSGLPLSFSTAGFATILGNGLVSVTGVGLASITASQAGNATFCGANSVSQYFLINNGGTQCAAQTINFGTISDKTITNGSYVLNATASSNLPVSYQVSGSAILIGNNTISFTGIGQVSVTASQSGNTSICGANSIVQTFNVVCVGQTISFDSIPDKLVTDAAFSISAFSSSGLPLQFSIVGPASFIGFNILTVTGPGVAVITAAQSGYNTNYCAAASVVRYFSVSKLSTGNLRTQIITFNGINNVYVDHPPIILSAVTNNPSGQVYFTLIQGSPAILSGDTVKLTSVAGTVVIKASSNGDAFYNSAQDVVQTFTVSNYPQVIVKQPQIITFYALADRTVDSPPFILTGASTSGSKVDFVVVSGPAYIKNDTVFTSGKGIVKIKAYQYGNEFFYPADSVVQAFTVTDVGCPFLPATPAITSNTPLCTGDDLIVDASNIVQDGAIYVWKGPNNFTSTSQNFTISGITDIGSGNYEVTVSVGNCKSVPNYVRVDVYITPQVPVLNILQGDACKNNTTISIPNIYGAYNWFLNDYKISNAHTNTYSPGIKGTYLVQVFDSTKTCSVVSDKYLYNDIGTNIAPVISTINNETGLQSTAAVKYQWYLDKRLIIGANNQTVNILYNGNYKVYATYDDSCKLVSATYQINKSTLEDLARSEAIYTDSTVVWADLKDAILTIIPNPAENHFKVTYYSQNPEKVKCSILKSNGTSVTDKILDFNGLEHSAEFNTETWSSGVYILKIIDGKLVKWAKVVIY